jgi:outer membrane lipoprotein SlyB
MRTYRNGVKTLMSFIPSPRSTKIQPEVCVMKKKIAAFIGRVNSERMIGVISATALLLLVSVTLLGTQQVHAQSSQTSAAAQNLVTVPAGTRLMVKMIDPVDSDTNTANDRFRGELEANLMAENVMVAPKGTTVYGRLLTAESAGRTSGGELELDITDIMIDGTLHSLRTTTKEMQGQEGTSTATQTKQGAVTGAVAGAVVGTGAGFGARAGAIAGNVAGGSARGEKVKVPAGTLVEFTLDHPVSLPIAQQK